MISRESVRKELHGLLQVGVPSAQAVVAYQASDFEGKSPVVMITGAGTSRDTMTFDGMKARFFFGVSLFILHADPASGWTEEEAEDLIDQVEYEVAKTFEANQRSQYWEAIVWEESSLIDRITVSGEPFLLEVIPVAVEVFK